MHALYLSSVFLHIVAAALWVGGMGFFALVVVPTARRELDEAHRLALLRAAGARFARMSGPLFGLLILTGLSNLWLRGLGASLFVAEFWRTPFGIVLATKLLLVAVIIGASELHSREATKAHASSKRGALAAKLGRVTLLLSLVVVALAVMLVRGAP